MLTRLDRHATLARGLLLRGVSVLFIAWFMTSWLPPFLAHSGGLGPLDARMWYAPEEATRLLSALGPDGRAFYLRMIASDFVFIGFAAVGDLMLLGLLQRHLAWPNWPRRVLLVAVGADAVENLVTTSVILGAPPACFWLGGAATLVKQGAAMVILTVYAAGLVTAGARWLRAPRTA